jgi:hypothetical protein
MFEKAQIDNLFAELKQDWQGKPDFEKLHRDVDLGIAFYDTGRRMEGLDDRAVTLINKHKPA